jgi:hypothetical protein
MGGSGGDGRGSNNNSNPTQLHTGQAQGTLSIDASQWQLGPRNK